MRVHLTIAGLLLAALLVLWRPWSDSGSAIDADPKSNSAAQKGSGATPPSGPDSPKDRLLNGPHIDLKRSPLADELNDTQGSIQRDLATVQELFAHYRSVFGENPTGSNDEITAALSGTNERLFAPLPRGHSAINREGKLSDRWRTPFFFHSLSAEFIEIRSAGPDRRLWTDDDETLSNAPPDPAS